MSQSSMENLQVLRVERRARRMHEVMDRLQVERGVLARMARGEAYARARSRCLFCGTSDTCLRWLDVRQQRAMRPTFCPNLTLFDSCRAEQAVENGLEPLLPTVAWQVRPS